MQTVEFPDCCGVFVINKFQGGHPNADPDNCADPEDVDEYLAAKEKEYYGLRAGLMAILSQPQHDRVGHIFDERRWKLLLDVNNCRSGRKIYIWFRDLNPTPRRHKRIFGK